MNNNFENFGFLILAGFFGFYDEKSMEQGKLLLGKFMEGKDVEQVFSDYFKELPEDITKEKIIEMLNECKQLAIEKGIISEK